MLMATSIRVRNVRMILSQTLLLCDPKIHLRVPDIYERKVFKAHSDVPKYLLYLLCILLIDNIELISLNETHSYPNMHVLICIRLLLRWRVLDQSLTRGWGAQSPRPQGQDVIAYDRNHNEKYKRRANEWVRLRYRKKF